MIDVRVGGSRLGDQEAVNEKKKLSDMQFVGRLVFSLAFFDQVSEREVLVVLWILW